MIRLALYLLIAISLGGLMGYLITVDTGYVLFAFSQYTLESTIWGFAALVLILLIFLYVVKRVGRGVWPRVASKRNWRLSYRERQIRRLSGNGLTQFALQDWRSARDTFVRLAQKSDTPAVHYLQAASAAINMNELRDAGRLLAKASDENPFASIAVNLEKANVKQVSSDLKGSRQVLEQLFKQRPKSTAIAGQLAECCERLGDWKSAQDLWQTVSKLDASDTAYTDMRIVRCIVQRFQTVGSETGQSEKVEGIWHSVPRKLKNHTDVVTVFAKVLITERSFADAEIELRRVLNQRYEPEWINLYGKLSADPQSQLKALEKWSKKRVNDPDILLARGRLQLANKNPGDAKKDLEASYRIRATRALNLELSRLYLTTGDAEAASKLLAEMLDDKFEDDPAERENDHLQINWHHRQPKAEKAPSRYYRVVS